MYKHYDVVVIGGGPAGASAAFFLGQAGQSVLLLEKQALPRSKPCAGAMPRAALRAFPFFFDSVIVDEAAAVGYAWREQEPRFVSVPPHTVTFVDRARFDTHLLSHCQGKIRDRCAVVKVHQREDGVTVETRGDGSLSASYAVLACGSTSSLPRALGVPRGRLAPSLVTEVARPELLQRFQGRPFFTFGLVPGGYFWLFPKGDHLSAGLFTRRRRIPHLRDLLCRAIKRWGVEVTATAAGSTAGNGRVARAAGIQAHPVPLYRRGAPRLVGRVLLAGDAAGLADPLLGEGIRHAITSGQLAAQALLQGRPRDYPAWVEATIGRQLRGAYFFAWLTDSFPRWAGQVVGNNPVISADFVRLSQGKASYVRLLLRMPLYLSGLAKGG